jgi:hypothetical protein
LADTSNVNSLFADPTANLRHSSSSIARNLYNSQSAPLYVYQADDDVPATTFDVIAHNPASCAWFITKYAEIGVELQVNNGGNPLGVAAYNLVNPTIQSFLIAKLTA